eukprot:CAMPEP_0176434682 /NCGR_PEP_ID=MMETSP0127-20121128/16831_1 /TAXON_ID=938130 /ORGANISM="Platyophrya macrostoma, Strain WH" /LENGTH=266 /DNA_ID=CAMNT_0017817483 /DNA_START=114 /DNA_END=914 /DNA_ORIENTATION=+
MTASIPTLMYLDDRPVTQYDRLLAEAFVKDGREGERLAREKYNAEKRQKEIEWNEKNEERAEIMKKRRQLELERYANDDLKEKERILDKKKELLEKKPNDYENSLKNLDHELERIEQELAQKQEIIDRMLSEAIMSKYTCVSRTMNENGEYEYVNVNKEEYEKYMKEQKKKAKSNQVDNSVKGLVWTPEFDELMEKILNIDDQNFEQVSSELTKALYQKQVIKANEMVTPEQIKARWSEVHEKPKTTESTSATTNTTVINELDELE